MEVLDSGYSNERVGQEWQSGLQLVQLPDCLVLNLSAICVEDGTVVIYPVVCMGFLWAPLPPNSLRCAGPVVNWPLQITLRENV